MIRVAFIINDYNKVWNGGLNYYCNLLNAICDLPDKEISPVIITGTSLDKSFLKGYPDVEIIKSKLFDRYSLSWFFQRSMDRYFSRDILLEGLLKKNRIDFLSHSKYPLNPSTIPWSTWITDFQTIHLPELFSKKEYDCLTNEYKNLGSKATRIIVSSNDGKNDLVKFLPELTAKVSVLQFVSKPRFEPMETDLLKLQQKYNFQGSFFLVPNQFWAHKNHQVIVEALKILRLKKRDILILATGRRSDTRNQHHYPELMRKVNEFGLSQSFKALGEISYTELTCLMVNSIAMINPSFFEGWSTSVEEAKSLGKKIVLSNIPVHKEQNPDNAVYFDARNAQELAEILWREASSYDFNVDAKCRMKAKEQFPQRWQSFGRAYSDIVMNTIKA